MEFKHTWKLIFKRKWYPKRKTRTETLEKVLNYLLFVKKCFLNKETFENRVHTQAAKILREFSLSKNETLLFLMLRYANASNIDKLTRTLIVIQKGEENLLWKPIYNLSSK